ncbi:kelch-like protein 1 [Lampris incognitus]|uniref:kelch-like protein 1 n=1 Tax=Lampris incognitus TaxID=2546036 RepID=UPI0024B4F26F|nr:kelch-like protein 1 [Lampris incognitus]
MKPLKQYVLTLFLWISSWVRYGLLRLWRTSAVANTWRTSPGAVRNGASHTASEEWRTDRALRTFPWDDGTVAKVTIQTSTHAFYVDLERLSECSEYFRALSQSRMRETSESLIHLEHVSSSIFYNLLELSFHDRFKVPSEELGDHIQVGSYLLAEVFLSKCLSALVFELNPDNCLSYLALAQEICCAELKMTVLTYLSRNLLELSHLTRCLNDDEHERLLHLRMRGDQRLCSLRKENLTSWNDPETESARQLFTLGVSEDIRDWHPITEFPFRADKWCFSTAVLYNYLYIIGGYRQRKKKGWEFKMASYRYNPFTHTWSPIMPLIKHRRHFSAVACEGCIYAVGGWYLDSLVTPDSSTALYTAVERYDPWEDTWRFVSSLPLTDFHFTMSLSHDVPLATSLGHCLYVLGNIQRTGEKLVLQYDTRHDLWAELLPTLTRADANLPTLYFLGATDRLIVIGGNNSENGLTSFCVQSKQWGPVRGVEKVALAGQGTVLSDQIYMPAIEHNSIVKLDLRTLSLSVLPALPVSTRYEAIFHLYF